MKRYAAMAVLAMATIALTSSAAATAAATPTSASVGAYGSSLFGGLGFAPSATRVALGGTVRWTSHDSFDPYTVTAKATDASGQPLFDLGGTYRGTLNHSEVPGFGPKGHSVQTSFPYPGNFAYYDRVHPGQMSGSVAVPVTIKVIGNRRHRHLSVTWATAAPPAGAGFAVQRRFGHTWKYLQFRTAKRRGTFSRKGGPFRARVRFGNSGGLPWSPPARP